MDSLEQIAKTLHSSGKKNELERLAASANGKRLQGMVDGAALEAAVKSGDAASLQKMLGALLSTPEGKTLAADVQKIMGR